MYVRTVPCFPWRASEATCHAFLLRSSSPPCCQHTRGPPWWCRACGGGEWHDTGGSETIVVPPPPNLLNLLQVSIIGSRSKSHGGMDMEGLPLDVILVVAVALAGVFYLVACMYKKFGNNQVSVGVHLSCVTEPTLCYICSTAVLRAQVQENVTTYRTPLMLALVKLKPRVKERRRSDWSSSLRVQCCCSRKRSCARV